MWTEEIKFGRKYRRNIDKTTKRCLNKMCEQDIMSQVGEGKRNIRQTQTLDDVLKPVRKERLR